MGKYANIINYFRQCPLLEDLWGIASTEDEGVNVIFPQGASTAVQYNEKIDALGNYICEIDPFLSVYEDFQINCYKVYDVNDSSSPETNINVLSIDEVQSICDWVQEQNEISNFPDVGEKVVSITCEPFTPQIQFTNAKEDIIAYFITVRLRYVNPQKPKVIEYALED